MNITWERENILVYGPLNFLSILDRYEVVESGSGFRGGDGGCRESIEEIFQSRNSLAFTFPI